MPATTGFSPHTARGYSPLLWHCAIGYSHKVHNPITPSFQINYMPDNLLNLVFAFFVLSLLAERVAEWLKFQNWFKWLFGIGNTTLKLPSEKLEQKRYFRILKINIGVAIMVAILIRADIFYLFNHQGDTILGWPDKLTDIYPSGGFRRVLKIVLGCVCTGFFLSFGSKLWHDLLDIVLAFKEAKRQVAGGFSVNNPGNFTALNKEEQRAAINGAVETFTPKWQNTIPGFAGVGIGKKTDPANPSQENLVLEFLVDKNKQSLSRPTNAVPSIVNYGGIYIPTTLRAKSSPIKPQWKNPGGDTQPPRAGQSISRLNNNITGTISLKVTREENGSTRHYLLSCYHVLFGAELQSGTLQVQASTMLLNSRELISPGTLTLLSGHKLGNAEFGHINEFVDAGVALLDDVDALADRIDELGMPSDIHLVTDDDINKLEIQFCGAKSGKVTGKKIKACNQRRSYNISPQHSDIFLRDLIELDKCSEDGDSGAPVMDDSGNLIGIVVGADDSSTYVIPIQNIINNLGVFPTLKSKPLT